MSLTLRLLNYGEPPPERLSVTFDERGGSIGRGPENDWSIPDTQKQVSRVHALIEYRGGAYFIIDKSANGIFRNDEPQALAANHPVAISDGDRLTLGNFTAVASIDWAAAMTPTRAPAADQQSRAFVPRESADGFGPEDAGYGAPNPFAAAFEPEPGDVGPGVNMPGMPELGPGAVVPDVLDLAGGAAEGGEFERMPGEEFAPERAGLRTTEGQHTPAHRDAFDPVRRTPHSAGSNQDAASAAPRPRSTDFIPDLPTQWKVRDETPNPGRQGGRPDPVGTPSEPLPPPSSAPSAPESLRTISDSDWKVRDNWKERDDEFGDAKQPASDAQLAPAQPGADVDSAARPDVPGTRVAAQPTVAQMPEPDDAPKMHRLAMRERADDGSVAADEVRTPDVPPTAYEDARETPEAPAVPTGPAAVNISARDREAVQALFKGMGLGDFKIDDAALPAVMETIGQVFREATAGVRDVLMVRTKIRNEFRVQHTMLRPKENNPLKFSVTIEDALHKLIRPSSKGFLPPVEAMREAFKDLAGHEVATVTGMRAGLDDVLSRFEPAALEKRMQKDSLIGSLLPATRKARLWELFVDNYATIMVEAEGDFEELFGREFAQAYEREMDQIRRASAAARDKSRKKPKG